MKQYKITYLRAGESDIIYSRFFDKIEPALDFAHGIKTKWLLTQNENESGDNSSWKILPYGDYKAYKRGLFIDSIFWMVVIVAGIFIAYKIFTMLKPANPFAMKY